MGFLPDLNRIISQLPNRRQSLFFSATLPPKIIELSKRLLRNPTNVDVTQGSTSVKRIEQRVVFVERSEKRALLRKVLMAAEVDRALVFTRTKRGAQNLAERLARSGIKATAIHGNKSQTARQRALAAFQRKQVQVLVATDVAARGIDVDGITHVVNFDLPSEPESYVHRIGRTGRAGAEGIALSFCSASERRELRAIERLIGTKVPLADEQLSHQPPEHRRSRKSRDRHSTSSRRSDSGFPRRGTASAGALQEDNKPNGKRRVRRKGQYPRQPAKQRS